MRENANKKGNAAFHVNAYIMCKKSSRPTVILMLTTISAFERSQVGFFPSAIAKNEVVMVTPVHARSFPAHLLEYNKMQQNSWVVQRPGLWFCSDNTDSYSHLKKKYTLRGKLVWLCEEYGAGTCCT